MARNIEIKARIASVQALVPRAAALATEGPIDIQQDDTFFRCDNGRLKLRAFSATSGELIFYCRPDQQGPKASFYLRSPTPDPDTLREGSDAGVREAHELMAALRVESGQLIDGPYVDLLTRGR